MFIQQGDFKIYLMDFSIFNLSYFFTGRVQYIEYPHKTIIKVEIGYYEPYIFFKPKPTLHWVNENKIKIHYSPLPINETITECNK